MITLLPNQPLDMLKSNLASGKFTRLSGLDDNGLCYVLISHGHSDGTLDDLQAISDYIQFCELSGIRVWVICCFGFRVANKYPNLQKYVYTQLFDSPLNLRIENETIVLTRMTELED